MWYNHLTMSYHPSSRLLIHLFISNYNLISSHSSSPSQSTVYLIISHLHFYVFPFIYSLLPTGNIGSNDGKMQLEMQFLPGILPRMTDPECGSIQLFTKCLDIIMFSLIKNLKQFNLQN